MDCNSCILIFDDLCEKRFMLCYVMLCYVMLCYQNYPLGQLLTASGTFA